MTSFGFFCVFGGSGLRFFATLRYRLCVSFPVHKIILNWDFDFTLLVLQSKHSAENLKLHLFFGGDKTLFVRGESRSVCWQTAIWLEVSQNDAADVIRVPFQVMQLIHVFYCWQLQAGCFNVQLGLGSHQCSAWSVASWTEEDIPILDYPHLWDKFKCESTMLRRSA